MHLKKSELWSQEITNNDDLIPLLEKPQIIHDACVKGFDIKPTAREHGVYPHQVDERGWESCQYSKYLLEFQH